MHILEKILGSRAKIRILNCLSEKKEMQLSEIKESAGMSISTIHEAMKDLVELRVVSARKIGKTRLYRINQSNYFARISLRIIEGGKTFCDLVLKEYVKRVKSKNIANITVFGSFARGREVPMDIDVLTICRKHKAEIKDKVINIEGELLKKHDIHVSTIVLSLGELKRKYKRNDRFIINVIAEGRKMSGTDLEALAHGKRG